MVTFPRPGAVWRLSLAALISLSACSARPAGGDCSEGLTSCGTECVNLQLSARHCGACNEACGPGLSCEAGACVAGCGAEQLSCGGVCTNVKSDPNNCGTCGNVCGTEDACCAGACLTALGTDPTLCVQTNECAPNPCEHGGTCTDAVASFSCACAPGFSGPTCAITGVQSLSAGTFFSCALIADGSLKCWGHNSYGQLGLGDSGWRGDGPDEMGSMLPAVELGTGRTAKAISAGGYHACALLDDHSLKCWGFNASGELGQGDTEYRGDDAGELGDDLLAIDLGTGRFATAVAAGASHTCALLDDGSVKCWGTNDYGELGQGDMEYRGNASGQMGDNLARIDLGTGRTAKAITAGTVHACALLDDGSVKCWGRNDSGQLGLGDTRDRGASPGEMGDNLSAINLGTGRSAKAISSGGYHVCALLDDGSVKCWGNNGYGQLGQGDGLSRGDGPNELGDALPAVDLGAGRTAKALAARDAVSCAVLDDNSLKCWGRNSNGRIGLGDTESRGDGAGEMGDNLPRVALGTGRTVKAIAPGGAHACALLDDNSVKCWGHNVYGELGLGDSAARGDSAGEMGDSLPPVQLW